MTQTTKAGKSAAVKKTLPDAGKIHIYCKLPNGLRLALSEEVDITLAGANSSAISGGYGRTEAKTEVWEQIQKNYRDAPWLKNGYVYAHVSSVAADRDASGSTGLEALSEAELQKRSLETIKGK